MALFIFFVMLTAGFYLRLPKRRRGGLVGFVLMFFFIAVVAFVIAFLLFGK